MAKAGTKATADAFREDNAVSKDESGHYLSTVAAFEFCGGLGVHAYGFLGFEGVLFLLEARGLVALGTELHEGFGFDVETGDVAIDDRLPDNAEGSLEIGRAHV